jgi:uncharacterized protein YcbK (DUF882 family)
MRFGRLLLAVLLFAATAEAAPVAPQPKVHVVHDGQRLGSIAKRYNVTVEALCEANRLRKTDTLKLGQTLVIPPSDMPVSVKLGVPAEARAKRSARRGYLELYTYTARWRGQVTDSKGRVLGAAITGISRLLGATGNKPRLDPRLIRLLAEVSDQFGGRPIRIVSGYRTNSYYDDSRHRMSRAVDFSIPGVSNETVRDYLRRFERVGVGYYPNSSFVHLDVRENSAYWVDYAGPGEAPRSKPRAPSAVASVDSDDHDHDHDDEAEQAAAEHEPSDTNDAAPKKEAEVATGTGGDGAPTKPASFRTSSPAL